MAVIHEWPSTHIFQKSNSATINWNSCQPDNPDLGSLFPSSSTIHSKGWITLKTHQLQTSVLLCLSFSSEESRVINHGIFWRLQQAFPYIIYDWTCLGLNIPKRTYSLKYSPSLHTIHIVTKALIMNPKVRTYDRRPRMNRRRFLLCLQNNRLSVVDLHYTCFILRMRQPKTYGNLVEFRWGAFDNTFHYALGGSRDFNL